MEFMEAVKVMEEGKIMHLPTSAFNYKFRVEPRLKGCIQLSNKTGKYQRWVIADMQLGYLKHNWEVLGDLK